MELKRYNYYVIFKLTQSGLNGVKTIEIKKIVAPFILRAQIVQTFSKKTLKLINFTEKKITCNTLMRPIPSSTTQVFSILLFTTSKTSNQQGQRIKSRKPQGIRQLPTLLSFQINKLWLCKCVCFFVFFYLLNKSPEDKNSHKLHHSFDSSSRNSVRTASQDR